MARVKRVSADEAFRGQPCGFALNNGHTCDRQPVAAYRYNGADGYAEQPVGTFVYRCSRHDGDEVQSAARQRGWLREGI